jgi:hypothetical protein
MGNLKKKYLINMNTIYYDVPFFEDLASFSSYLQDRDFMNWGGRTGQMKAPHFEI